MCIRDSFLDRAIGRHQSLAVRDLLRNDYAISGGEQMSRDELHSGLLLASTSMPPSSPEGGTSAGRWEGQVASASISGVLDLGSADLRELPPFVRESASLDSLKRLSLSGNELSELSLQAGRLGRLQQLSLFNNKLTKLPPELANLGSLTSLYLDYNQLAELPDGLCELTELRKLGLYHNRVASISEKIGSLTRLNTLALQHNRVVALSLIHISEPTRPY